MHIDFQAGIKYKLANIPRVYEEIVALTEPSTAGISMYQGFI